MLSLPDIGHCDRVELENWGLPRRIKLKKKKEFNKEGKKKELRK